MSLIKGIKKLLGREGVTWCFTVDTLMPHESFWRCLQRERERSDRSGLGFTLSVFDFGNNGTTDSALTLFLSKLQNRMRTTDELGWFDKNKIGAYLFNTDAEGAWTFVNNLETSFNEEPPYREVTVYKYPDDVENEGEVENTRRFSERVDLSSSVELFLVADEHAQNPIYLEIENISTGGIYILTESPLPVGVEVEVHLKFSLEEFKKLPGRSTSISAMGQVVRVDQRGMAISFHDDFRVHTVP